MRALFSIVSLLVVLAIVGMLAARQLKTAVPTLPPAPPSVTGAAEPLPTPGNVREQSQALQQRVQSDVGKALEQGAAIRGAADK